MIKAIDNMLVKLDFDRRDLESVRSRPYLYTGIALSLIFTTIFTILTVIELAG